MSNKLTQAQQKALDWLPKDITWRMDPGRLVSALNSLSIALPGGVDHEWGSFGKLGGMKQRWRLNESGLKQVSAHE